MTRRTSKTAPSQAQLSIRDLMDRAKAHIEAGESHMHQAADDVAAAHELGATQCEIAEAVGKSQAWVNGLLKWRRSGWADTPFGPQAKAARAARNYQATNNHQPNNPKPLPKPLDEVAAVEAPPIADEVVPAPNDDDDKEPHSTHPSYSAIWLIEAFRHVVEYPETLSEIIDLVGPEIFRNLIATLQAAYEDKYSRASADHADDEDAGRPLVAADAEQDAAAIAAEASQAKKWLN
jgi:hypothetical protein